MLFRMLHHEASGELTYLLADLDAGEAVVIDPRAEDVAVLKALLAEHRLRLRRLLRTHEHAGRRSARERASLPALEAERTGDARLPRLLAFGHEHLEVLPTPGHTSSCVSYRWRDRLFCGELLQVEGCRFQPQPADPQALWNSVTETVFALPPETLLFSSLAREGRAVSTVLAERRWHPWFGAMQRDEFMARVAKLPRHAARPAPA